MRALTVPNDLVATLVARDIDTLCGILRDLVPQGPYRDAKQARGYRSIPMGMSKRFQDKVPLDNVERRAD
jgi:hypothetical protein